MCAPTGLAAHNVHGQTIHSLLSLPLQHGYEPSYEVISQQTLKKLCEKFKGVHTILILEISMVSANTLHQIDKRLSHIKDTYTLVSYCAPNSIT